MANANFHTYEEFVEKEITPLVNFFNLSDILIEYQGHHDWLINMHEDDLIYIGKYNLEFPKLCLKGELGHDLAGVDTVLDYT